MGDSIAVTAPLPGNALERLEARWPVRVREEPGPMGEEEMAAFVGTATAAVTLLSHPVTARVLEACPALRIVANYAVGHDNVDLEAARTRGIWVTNTPDVLTEATADLAWALILGVTRRILEGDALVRRGGFHGWEPSLLLGTGLQGKTLGIVGFGRIGQAVARRAPAFGMEVLYASRTGRSGAPGRRVELEELLAASHVVSLHCPLTPATHHLLDARRLVLMRPGAVLINTARGPVVDEAALVEALSSGRLGGAGLDVYEREPEVHPGLLELPNVMLLPHVGSATVETRSAMADLVAANVEAVLEGREPPTPVVRGDR